MFTSLWSVLEQNSPSVPAPSLHFSCSLMPRRYKCVCLKRGKGLLHVFIWVWDKTKDEREEKNVSFLPLCPPYTLEKWYPCCWGSSLLSVLQILCPPSPPSSLSLYFSSLHLQCIPVSPLLLNPLSPSHFLLHLFFCFSPLLFFSVSLIARL